MPLEPNTSRGVTHLGLAGTERISVEQNKVNGKPAVSLAEAPRPLMREVPPAEEFPLDCLPPLLRDTAAGIHDIVQAPLAICAQSVLATAALAVQGHADIKLPVGRPKPVSCYFITIAESGERKSTADNEATWAIKEREKELRDRFEAEHEKYLNEKQAWDERRKDIQSDKKLHDTVEKMAGALNDLGPEPPKPLTPMLVCPEPTFEGLVNLFDGGQPSLGIFSAEGGQFIGGHGMTEEAKLRTATGLSNLWDGEPVKRVRAKTAATYPGRRLSLHLMVQPEVSQLLLADSLLNDQGMISRILISAPESAAGTRMYRTPNPASDEAIRRYGGRLLGVLERQLPLAEGKTNELAPRVMEMSQEAQQWWFKFSDHIEKEIGPKGEFASVRGLANKIPEHAARLGAIMALANDIDAPILDIDALQAGIILAEYYLTESLRLTATGLTDPDLLLAQKTLDWVREHEKSYISLPDLYRNGPRKIRDAKTSRKITKILEEHGFLTPTKGPVEIDGEMRREAWEVWRGL